MASDKIFVIDDDEAVRDSLKAMLEADGYTVTAFPSCLQFMDCDLSFENVCLILDLNMPGMDGWQLLADLAARHISLRVILISGRTDVAARKRAAGYSAVLLPKPIDQARLKQEIEAILG